MFPVGYFLSRGQPLPVSIITVVLQVDDVNKAIKDLEGKIRPLNPEPQVWC